MLILIVSFLLVYTGIPPKGSTFSYPGHQEWTTTADFQDQMGSYWTHSNTVPVNDGIKLASTTKVMNAKLPTPRYGTAAAYNSQDNKIYVFTPQLPVIKFDPNADTVTTLGTYLPQFGGQAVHVAFQPATQKAYIFFQTSRNIAIYDLAQDSLSIQVDKLPQGVFVNGAFWDTDTNTAFAIAMTPNGSALDLYEYNPVANTVTDKGVTAPWRNGFATIWNATAHRAYAFGGYDTGGTPVATITEINPGTGAFQTVATLTSPRDFASAVWDSGSNKSYIFGGFDGTSQLRGILQFPNGGTSTTSEVVTLSTARDGSSAAWQSSSGKAYIFGGNRGFYGMSDEILEFNPSALYPTSGISTNSFSPAGATQDPTYQSASAFRWESAQSHATLNGQSVTIEFASADQANGTGVVCGPTWTGWTTTITAVPNSSSLCIRITLSTTNQTVTPTLDDMTINYTAISAPPPPTGGTTSTPTAAPCPPPTAPVSPCSGGESLFYSYAPIGLDRHVTIDSDAPGTNFSNRPTVLFGNQDTNPILDGVQEKYALVRFPMTSLSTNLASASLIIPLRRNENFASASEPPGTQIALTVNRVSSAFDPATVTWNTQPSEDPGTAYQQTVLIPTAALRTTSNYNVVVDISRYVGDALANVIPNEGFIITVVAGDTIGNGVPLVVQFDATPGTPNAPYVIYQSAWSGPASSPTPTPSPVTSTPPLTSSPTPSGGSSTPPLTDSPTPSSGPSTPPLTDSPTPTAGSSTPPLIDTPTPAPGPSSPPV